MFVKCKFLDENKQPKGRDYTYSASDNLCVGDLVVSPDGKELIITEINASVGIMEGKEDKLKGVVKAIIAEPQEEITVIDEKDLPQDLIQEIQFNPDELIIVEQLPIITEQLAALSEQIDIEIEAALSLECSEDNKQIVKKTRARLNKNFAELDARRKIVQSAIEEPYKQFETVFKQFVSTKYSDADSKLKAKIDAVELEQKKRLQDGVSEYFDEYSLSKNIDFVKFENTGIKIGVSDNLTNLKKQVKAFIDKVVDDLALIETEDCKVEMMVEYKKSLNASQAIMSVKARHKAIEEQKVKQAEADAKELAQREAVAKVDAVVETQQALAPPTVTTNQEPPKPEENKKYTVAFKVTDTKENVSLLVKLLKENSFEYQQISLKNIIEEQN